MSRRTQAPKRIILPDPKHDSLLLAKFINMLMKSGKKSIAEAIVYKALEMMSSRSGGTEEQALERPEQRQLAMEVYSSELVAAEKEYEALVANRQSRRGP